jgi:hypothetical protein
MWRSRCPGLKSRSHYSDQPPCSSKHVGCPLCLPVRCEGSGSLSEQHADSRSGPVRDLCCATSLLWRSVGPLEKSWKHPSSSKGKVHRWSPSGHGAENGSSSSTPTKQHRLLPQHKSHEGRDKHACRPPPTHQRLPLCRWTTCALAWEHSWPCTPGPWWYPTRTVDHKAMWAESGTPRCRIRTLKLLERALALNLSCQGHSTRCSQMGHCYHHGCGWHPPHVMAQQAPPSFVAK